MLNKYTAAPAPTLVGGYEPDPLAIMVNGQLIGSYSPPHVAVPADPRAAFSYDIMCNDQLVATVYGKTMEQAEKRAERWAGMLTAAAILTNGEGDV